MHLSIVRFFLRKQDLHVAARVSLNICIIDLYETHICHLQGIRRVVDASTLCRTLLAPTDLWPRID